MVGCTGTPGDVGVLVQPPLRAIRRRNRGATPRVSHGLGDMMLRAATALGPNARFAVVGGLAVSVRSEPRFTGDVDFAVAVSNDEEAEQLVNTLIADGYVATIIVEHEVTRRLATARLQHPADDGRYLDLLFASSGIEAEIVAAATDERFSTTLTLPVATCGHLIAVKLLSANDVTRRRDLDDLDALASVATSDDWSEAAEAAQLITTRGYNRDRDLPSALATLRAAREPH